MIESKLKSFLKLLGAAYQSIYVFVCGRSSLELPWHFQWLAVKYLKHDLKSVLGRIEGDVLDYGCGLQPYRSYLIKAESYTAADIADGPGVDAVIVAGEALPYPDDSFDALLCTQVFEHVSDLSGVVSEVTRVLKPGGILVLSVPFIFQLHGTPHDYRRLSEFGVRQELPDYVVEKVYRQGAIGSSLAVLLLNWVENQLNVNTFVWLCRFVLLPVWILFCLFVNMTGWLFDKVDTTGTSYGNVMVVARKK